MEQKSSLVDDLVSPKTHDSKLDCGLTKVKSQMDEEAAEALEKRLSYI